MINFSVNNSGLKRFFNSTKKSKIVYNSLKCTGSSDAIRHDKKMRISFFAKLKNKILGFKEFCSELRHDLRRNFVYIKCGDEWVRDRDVPSCAKGFEQEFLIRKPFRKDKIIDAKTYYEDKW